MKNQDLYKVQSSHLVTNSSYFNLKASLIALMTMGITICLATLRKFKLLKPR
jgi:hypothetical protein